MVSGKFQLKRRTLPWYTDGSKIEQVGTCIGVGGPNYRLRVPIGLHPNIFRTEISAINLYVVKNLKIRIRGAPIYIFTES